MSTTTPPAVWLDKFSEGFFVELLDGAATNLSEHDSLSFLLRIINDDEEPQQFQRGLGS
jgi:hypothetical protein